MFVAEHLTLFASEFGWTPAQVWDLSLGHLVGFSKGLDRLAAERKKALSERKRKR